MALTAQEEAFLRARSGYEKAGRTLANVQADKRAAQETASVTYQAALAAADTTYDQQIADAQAALDVARSTLDTELEK
jgi:hypothetical protein